MNHGTCSRCGVAGDHVRVQRHTWTGEVVCVECMTPEEREQQRAKLGDLRASLVDSIVGGAGGKRTIVVSPELH